MPAPSRMKSAARFARAWCVGATASAVAVTALPARAQPAPQGANSARAEKLKVLILGDSLALCGFGKRLDERFRNDPSVQSTFTYMACGTNPLSWLKQKPYTSIKASCGFWSIESAAGASQPKEMQDTYGMKRNQTPKAHPVPKLEDLLERVQPDILVVQTGSNLFGLFPDAKTVNRGQHASALKNYFLPFKTKAIAAPSTLRKIYWVASPTSGRVSAEVQEFVFQQTKAQLSPPCTVIDSRALVSYPYKHMDPDKEHFLGDDMTHWADKVFEEVTRDLAAQPISAQLPLAETQVEPLAQPPPAPAESPKPDTLEVEARLVFKSQPMQLKELLPYQESLVAYVYDVGRVIRGEYREKQILVMHPSYIALKKQPLDKYRIGKRYRLKLQLVEGTLWDTAKAKDESGQINLQPYLRVQDKPRHPGNQTR